MISRRLFLGGLLAGTAAPAIVKASSLMKIKAAPVGMRTGEILVIGGRVGGDVSSFELLDRINLELSKTGWSPGNPEQAEGRMWRHCGTYAGRISSKGVHTCSLPKPAHPEVLTFASMKELLQRQDNRTLFVGINHVR